MTGIEILVMVAIAGWITAAPDRHSLRVRGGSIGALRSASIAAGAKARAEWDRGGAVRARKRTARRDRMRATTIGRFGLGLEWAAIHTGRALRSGARISWAALSAIPEGYRDGAGRAIERRTQRRQARAATRPGLTDRARDLDPEGASAPAAPAPAVEAEPAPAAGQHHPTELDGDAGAGEQLGAAREGLSAYARSLSPEQLARLRQLKAIRDAGYTGWLDQDLNPVEGPPLFPTEPARNHEDEAAAGLKPVPVSPADPGAGFTVSTKKEHVMPEVDEITTTEDLRTEAAELEDLAEHINELREEFERRAKALEEKVGAAPFGTRAIAEAVTAVGEAPNTDDALEALIDLREAVDEAEALGEVSEAIEASGQVEAFTTT